MMKKANKLSKIYIFGNPALEEDSLPVKLLLSLRKSFPSIEFIHMDPTENFPEEDNLFIIDTIINAKEVILLSEKDIDKMVFQSNVSLHDFDLGFQLKLLKKLGMISKVSIIGIPPNISQEKALTEIKEIIDG